ncbi:MAG: hypothetical protein RLZZ26_547 [Candidatus Parcubacteria bacterium]|jgi:hypothetical protein
MLYKSPTVNLACFDEPVQIVCERCESILAAGSYAVCVQINGMGKMLCSDEPRICCGIRHTVWRLSSDRSWMQYIKRSVVRQIEEGRIGSLKLDRDLMRDVSKIP